MAQSRREQLQAYRFLQRRVRTALLDADPDTNDVPLSRMGVATYAGLMVAVLLLAGAGIYGALVNGGSAKWRTTPGALIVERETSTRYVYLQNELFQVANYASAKLLLGDRLTVVNVSRRSLAGAHHGGDIGVPDAPDYVPDAKHVVGTTWSACSAGNLTAGTAAALDFRPGIRAGGSGLGDRAMLLSSQGRLYLLWQSHVFLLPAGSPKALSYTGAPAVAVSPQFLAALPRGEDLRSIVVPGHGGRGPLIGTRYAQVGEVLLDRSVHKYYLVGRTSVQILTPVQALLQLSNPTTPHGSLGATTLAGSSALAKVPVTALPNQPPLDQRGPADRPTLATVPRTPSQLCSVYDGAGRSTVVFGPQSSTVGGAATGGLVRLPTGYGALVSVVAHPGQPAGATYLVSDTSVKYPVTPAGLQQLGLAGLPTARLLPAVLNAIPSGPVLDPAKARQVIGAGIGPSPQPS